MGKTLARRTHWSAPHTLWSSLPESKGNIPVLVRPHMRRVAALRDDPRVGPHGAVRVELFPAVRLVVVVALAAVQARVALRAHADPLALLNQRHLGAYTGWPSRRFLGVGVSC